MAVRNLSKSKIIAGLQCPKRLYLEVHHPDLAEVSEESERKFEIGHQVGEVATHQFPGGVMIEFDDGLSHALKETRKILSESPDIPVYEATFSKGGVLVRADIFLKEKTGYRLVEVKASTSVKDYYLNDVAIQAWTVTEAGYPLDRMELAHIDNTFVYQGDGDYEGLFRYEDVKERALPLVDSVPKWVDEFKQVLQGDMPEIGIGSHCHDPFDCEFIGYCSPEDCPEYPVSILPRGGKIIDELIEEGIEDVRDIPDGRLSNQNHERVRRVTVSGVPEIAPEIRAFMKGLSYPRYYIDFETAQFAVPIWVGTRPYEQLPVQWSCHVENETGELEHREFLDISGNAPMKDFAESLIAAVGEQGAIIVYSSYEKTILRKLAEMHPEHSQEIERIIERLVDLLSVVRNHYYHPQMMGSWSIKAVLPTVAPDLNYSELEEIAEGGAAQVAYLEAIDPETTDERRNEIKDRLLEYCKLDTFALVKMVQYFSA